MPSAPSRALLSLLVIMVLLFGVVAGPVGGHSQLDSCAAIGSLLFLLILSATCTSFLTRRSGTWLFDSYLPAAPDRAPPPILNQTVDSAF